MESARIAVVEDEAIVALDIEDRLIAMGYGLAGRVATGEEALVLAAQQRPDLFLMDIHLQGPMDGITAAAEIYRRFHRPVIFLTAFSEEATLEKAKTAEPYGFILKPFDDRELKSAIEIALYKHGSEEEIRRLNRLYDVLSLVNQTVVRTRSSNRLLLEVCRLVVERGNAVWPGSAGFNPIPPGLPPSLFSEASRTRLLKLNLRSTMETGGGAIRSGPFAKASRFSARNVRRTAVYIPGRWPPTRWERSPAGSFRFAVRRRSAGS